MFERKEVAPMGGQQGQGGLLQGSMLGVQPKTGAPITDKNAPFDKQTMQDMVGMAVQLRTMPEEQRAASWPKVVNFINQRDERLGSLLDSNRPPTNEDLDMLLKMDERPEGQRIQEMELTPEIVTGKRS